MANPRQEPRPGELGARLRALRREHPTLAVLTEIVQLDEQRATFRATVRIDGETRAQGHAAQRADPAGDFVAAAEQLAVEQALLLGGFATVHDESPTVADPTATLSQVPPGQPAATAEESVASTDSPAPAATRRRSRRDHAARVSDSVVAPEVPGATTPAAPAHGDPPSSEIASPLVADNETGATTTPAEPPPAARRKRARSRQTGGIGGARADQSASQASRPEAGVSEVAAGTANSPQTEVPPGDSPESDQGSGAPDSPPATAQRRVRARATAPQQPRPAPEARVTREEARAAWQEGRPIPAWWPPGRIAVEKPLPKAQVERLRAVALDEEITATQLDTYSTMLFGSAVAGLNQAQGAILEERLNPAYPSPLQELSARRVLYPIAVGDTVTIPDEQTAFIRWRDVPPVEEAPAPPAPAPPSWRTGGAKRRRR